MQSNGEPKRAKDDVASSRLGSAALGFFGGGSLGLLVAVLVVFGFTGGESYFAPLVFGLAAIGAVAGYIRGSVGLGLAEGVVHVVAGFLVGLAAYVINPLPEAPRWLKAVYWLGLVGGLMLAARLYFWL
jgi:hypothetical protein